MQLFCCSSIFGKVHCHALRFLLSFACFILLSVRCLPPARLCSSAHFVSLLLIYNHEVLVYHLMYFTFKDIVFILSVFLDSYFALLPYLLMRC
jgi:hypothetical protein